MYAGEIFVFSLDESKGNSRKSQANIISKTDLFSEGIPCLFSLSIRTPS